MTSRLYPGGLSSKYSLEPDLITLGKYLGGGLAFGAFGGKKSLLESYNPQRPTSLPHSGTFNNNTLAMACGYAGLSQIYTPIRVIQHNALGDYMRNRLVSLSSGTKMVVTGVGAVLTIHFLNNGVTPQKEADLDQQTISGLKKLFWYWCIGHGFWITERGMLSIIIDTTLDEIDGFVGVTETFIQEYRHLLEL